LRRDPLDVRKATLASIVAKASSGIRFNEHMEGDGPTVFAHACKMGLEGIVSKRKDSAYRSGRSPEPLLLAYARIEVLIRLEISARIQVTGLSTRVKCEDVTLG